MSCAHDITERDIAVSAGGYCPLCQAVEIDRLRAAIEEQNGALAIMRSTRNAIIEECARVAEQHDSAALSWTEIDPDGSERKVVQSIIADHLRALKDKP